jgi:putative ABC transport system permease protein
MVNEAFARQHLAGTPAVGRRVRLSGDARAPWRTIVGISANVKHFGPALPARPEVFVPLAQSPFPFMSFVVRTDDDPLRLTPSIRAAAAAVDPTQPLAGVETMQTYLNGSLAQTRFLASLLAGFGALALLLAAVGIYGVMSWSVVERRREIGVRLAVGAPPSAIARMVLRQGGTVLVVGLGLGVAAAAGLGQVLAKLLYDVRPEDPFTYASTVLLLGAVALAALCLPAYRASRVDAVKVLHE